MLLSRHSLIIWANQESHSKVPSAATVELKNNHGSTDKSGSKLWQLDFFFLHDFYLIFFWTFKGMSLSVLLHFCF